MILSLCSICHAARVDFAEKLANFWVNTLGLEKASTFRSEKENVDEDVLRLGSGPLAVEVDIMQVSEPADGEVEHKWRRREKRMFSQALVSFP
jgi:hypothetical protein